MSNPSTGSSGGQSSVSQATFVPFSPQNHSLSLKLSENNFLIWKQQVLATVRGYGLEHFLTGEQDVPPQFVLVEDSEEMQLNPAFISWHRQDQLLSAWIQSSLSESTMVMIVGLNTSKDIWRSLETNYSSQSKAKVMQYKLQLQTMKKDSLSMREYLNKVKSCCDLLGSVGCRIMEEDQVLYILAGLGSEYDPVMVTITSRGEAWSVQDVTSLLLSFEFRLESSKGTNINTDGTQPSANMIQASGNRSDGHIQQNRGNQQHSRGGFGGRFNSFRGGRGGRGGRFSGQRLVCQVCQKPGHSADRCWYRFEHNFAPSSSTGPSRQQYQPHQTYSIPHQPPTPSANIVHITKDTRPYFLVEKLLLQEIFFLMKLLFLLSLLQQHLIHFPLQPL